MRSTMAVLALPLALGIAACSDASTGPERPPIPDGALLQRQTPRGAVGIVLENLTRVGVPVLGQLDELVIDQAVINEIVLGNVIGGVIGLEVTGTISGTVTGLGT